jgi:hypothetical protein
MMCRSWPDINPQATSSNSFSKVRRMNATKTSHCSNFTCVKIDLTDKGQLAENGSDKKGIGSNGGHHEA